MEENYAGSRLSHDVESMISSVASLYATDDPNALAAARILFPHGITKVKAEISVTGVGSASLEIEGPTSASSIEMPAGPTGQIAKSTAPPFIRSVEPTPWERSSENRILTIHGGNFGEPTLVSIDTLIVAGEPTRVNDSTIVVAVQVDEDCAVGDYDVTVAFKGDRVAKGLQVFKLRD